MSCGVSCRHGLDPTLLWLWRRPVAAAPIRPLAWEPPYATGVDLEKAKRQKIKTKTKNHCRYLKNTIWWVLTYAYKDEAITIIKIMNTSNTTKCFLIIFPSLLFLLLPAHVQATPELLSIITGQCIFLECYRNGVYWVFFVRLFVCNYYSMNLLHLYFYNDHPNPVL